MSLTSARRRSKRIGLAKSSTSVTMRFSRSVSSSMSATASRTSAGVTRRARAMPQRGPDDHQRIATSCAMTVDSRPSDDSRSCCAASRWNRAIESVSVLNVDASSRASSSSQARLRTVTFRVRSPVAATSRIASVTGGQRPRDRAAPPRS